MSLYETISNVSYGRTNALLSGDGGVGALDTVEAYDPQIDAWAMAASMGEALWPCPSGA